MRRLVVAVVCVAVALPVSARRIDAVTFPSLDRDAGGAVVLQGALLMPAGAPPASGFPAIIALHGCGGMYSKRVGHERDVAVRMLLRADRWLADGYVVLFVDSFRSRGVSEICTVRLGERTVTATRRRLDALGALAYLAARADVAGERIAIVGWSHGGSTALQAVNRSDPTIARFFARPDAPPFFRAAVAFYPGCALPLKSIDRYGPGTPTRVHIGELDDWTPARPCVELGTALAERGADFVVTTYPDSHHAFDAPGGRLVHRIDVPNGVEPGRGVHIGPNPLAREAANARVRAFLHERLSQ